VPLAEGEMVAGREPVDVADLAQDPGRQQRADPDHVDQPGPGGRDQLGELGQARGELLVELLQPYDPALRELRAHEPVLACSRSWAAVCSAWAELRARQCRA